MKTLIVVLLATSDSEIANATNNLKETSGVLRLSRTTWRIDAHKSLSFFATLLHNASERNIDCAVYEVENILQEHQPKAPLKV